LDGLSGVVLRLSQTGKTHLRNDPDLYAARWELRINIGTGEIRFFSGHIARKEKIARADTNYGRTACKRAGDRRRVTFLGYMQRAIGVKKKPLDLISVLKERMESEAVSADYGRIDALNE